MPIFSARYSLRTPLAILALLMRWAISMSVSRLAPAALLLFIASQYLSDWTIDNRYSRVTQVVTVLLSEYTTRTT